PVALRERRVAGGSLLDFAAGRFRGLPADMGFHGRRPSREGAGGACLRGRWNRSYILKPEGGRTHIRRRPPRMGGVDAETSTGYGQWRAVSSLSQAFRPTGDRERPVSLISAGN